jgi:Flp pilus assembly protein TadD
MTHGGGDFDLLLFGYRNDLARERVLDYLATLPPTLEGPALIDRATETPQRLFAQLPELRARQLRDDLEQLGAQITLVPLSSAPTGLPVPAFSSLLLPLISAVVGGAAIMLMLQLLPQPHRRTATRLPRVAAPRAIARLQPISLEPSRPNEQAQALQLNSDAVELAQHGQYDLAAERLRQALDLTPGQPVVTQNLQTVLLNHAIRELVANHPRSAMNRLSRALELGQRTDLVQTRGLAYFQAGELDRARADLEQAVKAGSKDPSTWLALGEVYLQQDDRPHALDALQRARELGAKSPELDGLLSRLGREVDAEWDFSAIESAHFRVTFSEGENRVAAQLVLDGLEDARNQVGAKFGYLPDHIIEAVLYGAQDFHAITQTPVWAGAAYDGRIKVPVRGLESDDPVLRRLLRHEYMHSLVADLSHNRCPVWLNEGLAVWAEEEQDGERRAWAEDTVRGASLFHLRDLTGPLTHLPPARAQVAYAQSYLAVRELVDRYGARKLQQFVTDLSRQPLAAAFAATYSTDLADFEDHWLRALTS